MSSETTQETVEQEVTGYVQAPWAMGVVGGLVGGLAMGIVLSVALTSTIESAIPALYTLDGGAIGWVAHMSHAAIFGVLFAAFVTRSQIKPYTETVTELLGIGIAYGAVLWVVAASVVMPIWLDAVGFANAPATPNFVPMSLAGHVIFGAVLGAAYWALR